MIKTWKIDEWHPSTKHVCPAWERVINGQHQSHYIFYIFKDPNRNGCFYYKDQTTAGGLREVKHQTPEYDFCGQLYQRDKILITQTALRGYPLAQALIREMETIDKSPQAVR